MQDENRTLVCVPLKPFSELASDESSVRQTCSRYRASVVRALNGSSLFSGVVQRGNEVLGKSNESEYFLGAIWDSNLKA